MTKILNSTHQPDQVKPEEEKEEYLNAFEREIHSGTLRCPNPECGSQDIDGVTHWIQANEIWCKRCGHKTKNISDFRIEQQKSEPPTVKG